MTEQDLLDMFIQERISMLIEMFHKNQTEKAFNQMFLFIR